MITLTQKQIVEAADSLDLENLSSLTSKLKQKLEAKQLKENPTVKVEFDVSNVEAAKTLAKHLDAVEPDVVDGTIRIFRQTSGCCWETVNWEVK